MLKIHQQNEWDKFINSLDPEDRSLYKLDRNLLHKTPANHPLNGQNGQVNSATD